VVQRSECLYNGQIIGIESIYTVINGKQINIPEKLADLREKSRRGELFCPCGCGANLILVAGDRNLREQHFRTKSGTDDNKCTAIKEGAVTIFSKIVLKCWLDDKIKLSDVESRVPINLIGDTIRKYEYTFLSRNRNIGLCYSKNRINLLDEKFDVLKENSKDISTIYVVDVDNRGTNGQYPEKNMKMQNRQGYCLFLAVNKSDYENARMIASFYIKDINGLWQEIEISSGLLSDYDIDMDNEIRFNGVPLKEMRKTKESEYNKEIDVERRRREENKRKAEELARKRAEERERINIILAKEKAVEAAKKEVQAVSEKPKTQEEIPDIINWDYINSNIDQQQKPVKDDKGRRWVKCQCCGEVKRDFEFIEYGGQGRVNLGTCKICFSENKQPQHKAPESFHIPKCPKCGSELKIKNGKFGQFYGCTSYPSCRYTRNID